MLRMRVSLPVYLFQAVDADMGINLGARKAFVTEHFLYNTQVGAGIKHVGGEGVAKSMGRYFMTCR